MKEVKGGEMGSESQKQEVEYSNLASVEGIR